MHETQREERNIMHTLPAREALAQALERIVERGVISLSQRALFLCREYFQSLNGLINLGAKLSNDQADGVARLVASRARDVEDEKLPFSFSLLEAIQLATFVNTCK